MINCNRLSEEVEAQVGEEEAPPVGEEVEELAAVAPEEAPEEAQPDVLSVPITLNR